MFETEMLEDTDEYIMNETCCMKQSIRNFIRKLIRKSLTDIEVTLLCSYQFMIMAIVGFALIRFQLAARCFVLFLTDLVPSYMITMLAVFINTMILLQLICYLKEFIVAFFCKCDYRMHPELD